VRRETESLGLDDGVLVASDGRAAAIFAEVEPEADRHVLLEQVRRIVGYEQGLGEYSLRLSGTALSQAVLGEAAAKDMVRLIPAVLVVLGAVLILAFRHPAPAFVSIVEIGISLVWTVGLMGFAGQSVFVTTLVMPVILLAIGVSDDVYALTHFSDEAALVPGGDRREVIVSAFVGVARSIGITTGSTVVGLLSLAITSLEPLRVFGIFGAVSILFSSLFTFTLVPALIALLGSGMARRHSGRGVNNGRRMLRALELMSAAGPRRILLVAVMAACSAVLLATRLRVDDSWVKNLPGASDISQGDKELNRLFAGTITLDLLVDSGNRDGFLSPETLKALGAVEDALSLLPAVGAVHTLYGDVARVSAALKGSSYADYRKALSDGRADMGREDIEQALMLMESVRRTHITERLDSEYRRTRMTVFIRSADYERIHEVLNTTTAAGLSLSHAGGIVTPFGDGWISYLTVQLLVRGQIWSIALALLTDLALLSFLLKSARSAAIAILPVSFSLVVVFAVLAATETPLGIANSMFAAIAIGIGLDFSIHLSSAYREGLARGLASIDSLKQAFTATGPAIVTSAAAITAGFSVLTLSEVSPNMQLGLMICLSLLVCAAATLVIIPSIVMAGRKV
jgi:predicted RND superfamily exporter protein